VGQVFAVEKLYPALLGQDVGVSLLEWVGRKAWGRNDNQGNNYLDCKVFFTGHLFSPLLGLFS